MMHLELILKLPKDKLPFVGILFNDSYAASTTNKGWANSYREDLYTLEVIPKGDLIADMRIVCSCGKGHYTDVKCNMQALKRFVQITHYHPYIHFGHAYLKNGEHQIAKTSNMANWVLKLATIKVVEVTGNAST